MDVDGNGTIHRSEFEDLLQSEKVFAVFRDMDIQADEALRLFDALDIDESGTIVAREFVEGCMDMQGTGSAYNQALMLRELADIKRLLKQSQTTKNGSVSSDGKGTLVKHADLDLSSADTTALAGEDTIEDL
eukprot:TRINITY_DN63834_c0_g1_i1.p2 TRINITY_DN63834_c0_g1~~TRINITY_DN63834_c0_g1_i1.p2  ORF type:complete len:132 (+),score=36.82 TRINITY_DN63834_c0_g1_i1:570-965(+)